MNERIKELKNITLDKHFSYTWTTMDYDDMSRFAEKFAELIVRECIDCINNTDKGGIFTAQSAGVVGAAHQRSIETIREHFGVEE